MQIQELLIMKYPRKHHEWRQYHLVKRDELKVSNWRKGEICAKEIIMRTKYTTKYYGGRFDRNHRVWVKTLTQHVTLTNKVNMSLDDLIVFQKAKMM